MPNAWITLATNDGYAVGALVLAHSLKQVGTQHELHILYTEGVSTPLRNQLHAVFTNASLVNVLDSNDEENLALIGRPDLGLTFTKLHAWRLTQYEKCVFLDADTLVLKNADELFDRPDFSAAPDIGWPDFFNSGVFVFAPSLETYRQLVQFGLQEGSFDGGDQGLLNKWFKNWREQDASHRLPFIYNMTAGAIYSYAAALKLHGGDVKIVHFLGRQKPWHSLKTGVHGNEHWDKWHGIFEENVKQHLPHHLLHYWYDTYSHTKNHHKARRSHHQKHRSPERHHHREPSPQHHHFEEHKEYHHHREPSPERHHHREPSPEWHHHREPSPEWHHHREPSPQYHHHFEEHKEYHHFEEHQHYEEPTHFYKQQQEFQNTEPFNLNPISPLHAEETNINKEDDGQRKISSTFAELTINKEAELKPASISRASSSTTLPSCCSEGTDLSDEESGDEGKWDRALGDWERGAIDYAGRDAFSNILSHIQQQLDK